MSFLTVGSSPDKQQRLYLLEIELPDRSKWVKIGKASGVSSKARMMQICESIFDKFRVTPQIKISKDQKVASDCVFKYETTLHRFFQRYRYDRVTTFDGSGELFEVDLATVKQAYHMVLDGETPNFEYCKSEDELPF